MTNAKAVYAAVAAILTAILLNLIPAEAGLAGLEYHIRLLVEVGVHAVVQSLAVYWATWWAPANAPAQEE